MNSQKSTLVATIVALVMIIIAAVGATIYFINRDPEPRQALPSTTQPADSAEPTEPAEATEPADPVEPTDPPEPVESTEPSESEEPSLSEMSEEELKAYEEELMRELEIIAIGPPTVPLPTQVGAWNAHLHEPGETRMTMYTNDANEYVTVMVWQLGMIDTETLEITDVTTHGIWQCGTSETGGSDCVTDVEEFNGTLLVNGDQPIEELAAWADEFLAAYRASAAE